MFAGVRLTAVDFGLPDQFSGVPIEAQDGLCLLHPIRSGEIDAIANDGWRTVPATRDG
jgi:hypothetical protein